jgi:hypothetical protein
MVVRRLVLGLMVGAALAGCGGTGSADGGDQFVRRVDALCKQANPELAEINAALIRARDASRAGQVSQSRTFETFANLLRRASAVTDRFHAQLREIRPPQTERDFHDTFLDSVERGSSNLRRQITAAEHRDAVVLSDLSKQGSVLNARSKGLLEGHGGFRVCGRA